MPDDLTRQATAIVNLSERICQFLGIGFPEPDTEIQLENLASSQYLGLTSKRLEEVVEQTKSSYETEKILFA